MSLFNLLNGKPDHATRVCRMAGLPPLPQCCQPGHLMARFFKSGHIGTPLSIENIFWPFTMSGHKPGHLGFGAFFPIFLLNLAIFWLFEVNALFVNLLISIITVYTSFITLKNSWFSRDIDFSYVLAHSPCNFLLQIGPF